MLPRIPGYHLDEVLARGEVHLLYRARREHDGRRVVLKTCGVEDPGPEDLARLAHEHEIQSSLDLPGVLPVLGLERSGSVPVLVLEDVGGRSLAQLLKVRRASVEQILDLAIRLAAILEAVHARGIVHLDVNPANIIVDDGLSQVWLSDFETASRLSQGGGSTDRALALRGTLAYIAPEQTGRMQAEVDERADLYSLGVSLYQALAGRLPFRASNPLALIHCHIAERPEPLGRAREDMPPALAAVVMKLLAKSPDERYLGAFGLRHDLLCCRGMLAGAIDGARFELGERDVMTRFRPSTRLYGRDQALARLALAVSRTVEDGLLRLVLVRGVSGAGKSTLIAEMRRPALQAGGLFANGKYEQVQRDVPYSGLVMALRELLEQVLTLEQAEVDAWAGRIAAALGRSGRILCEVLPELSMILGPQPEVEPLPATESSNRFTSLFLALIRACAGPAHPLVLVLDDLQWADSASLDLLRMLLRDEECSHLLVLGAYRRGDAETRLSSKLLALADATGPLEHLDLGCLGRDSVTALLGEQFRRDGAEIAPLADAVFEKTEGNPFFIQLFLQSLTDRRLLCFDPEAGRWDWNLGAIRGLAVTANVAEFMAERVHTLAEDARRLLERASCIGSRFDLGTLAMLCGEPPEQAARMLRPALDEHFVTPLGGGHELAEQQASAQGGREIRYRFVHDRVQQAAYEGLSEVRRASLHHRIGRLLLARLADGGGDELPHAVEQLNRGRSCIGERGERIEVAHLNLEAGRKAKGSAAFSAAASFFDAGVELLPADAWQSEPRLALELNRERAEALYLTGDLQRAELAFDALLERDLTRLEKARLYSVRLLLYTAIGRYAEAVGQGLAGLALLGVRLSAKPTLAALLIAHLRVRARLGRIDPAKLAPLDDPVRELVLELLVSMGSPCYLSGNEYLMAMTNLQAVGLSLRHGNGTASAYAYTGYALLLTTVFADPTGALKLAERVRELSLGSQALWYRSKILYLLPSEVMHWHRPFAEGLGMFEQAFQDCLDSGDNLFGCFCAIRIPAHHFQMGEPLGAVAELAEGYLKYIRRTGDQHLEDNARQWLQIYRALQGRTGGLLSWDAEDFELDKVLARMRTSGFKSGLGIHAIYRAHGHLLQGDFELAVEDARAARPYLSSLLGLPDTAAVVFFEALALASLAARSSGAQRVRWRLRLWPSRRRLASLARRSPANYRAGHLLVEAEAAAARGRCREAMDGYERAIDEALRQGLTHVEAMSREWAALFYQREGFRDIARLYLRAAVRAYRRWGAEAKADGLQALLEQWGPAMPAPGSLASQDSGTSGNLQLDLNTVIEAAETISGEILSERLLDRLIDLVVANAGAERGVLLIQGRRGLCVQAEREAASDGCVLLEGAPLASYQGLPHAVVNYVVRSLKQVVLRDAARDGGYATDAYIDSRQVRSVLCLPILRQGKLIAVLYLENNLAPGVFTAERVSLLSLLSSQMAISIENAELYRGLRQAADDLERYNRELESKVEERTGELNQALVQVGQANAEVLESLAYAKLIQESLLPTGEALGALGTEHFLLWLPRDLVGGDVFFVQRVGDEVVAVLADCTGHGVPGALMTVIAVSALRQIVEVDGCSEPAEILRRLNRMVRRALRQDAEATCADNGMDVAACCLDRGRGRLSFAGARVALHRVEGGEVVMVAGDRQSIGYRRSDPDFSFATHALYPAAGSWIYLASDGFADQLGTERGFPMGRTRFHQLLQACHQRPAQEQRTYLLEALNRHRGERPRQDDVTLIGFQL